MGDAETLVRKHRGKGVFVDANLLVLYLVGCINQKRILNFKRTENFTVEDFFLLQRLVDILGPRIFATPHILSQVSDLTDLSGQERMAVRRLFKSTVEFVEELHFPARTLVQHSLFERFGLGDASIATACEQGVLVLTADVQLQVALSYQGLDAVNFNHVRALGWPSSGSIC